MLCAMRSIMLPDINPLWLGFPTLLLAHWGHDVLSDFFRDSGRKIQFGTTSPAARRNSVPVCYSRASVEIYRRTEVTDTNIKNKFLLSIMGFVNPALTMLAALHTLWELG